MRGIRVYICIIITIAISFSYQSSLFAGLKVDPVVLEAVVSKESPTQQSFRLGNTGKKPIKVRVELKKKRKEDRVLADWFVIKQRVIELNPGEEKEIPYKITLPEDAEGELRCMVFFVADELGKNRSSVGIRFGVPVYAIVKETVKPDAEVDRIDVKYEPEKKSISGIVYVENKGNIHIRPYIDIEVLEKGETVKGSFEIPFGQPAQVGQKRPFMFSQKMELAPGSYKLKAKVDYGRMYNQKDLVVTKETEFEVKPAEPEAEEAEPVSEKKSEEKVVM